MKNFFASKINWMGIVAILVGLEDFIKDYNFADITPKGWVTFSIGVLVVIFRTYFTSKTIGTTKAV